MQFAIVDNGKGLQITAENPTEVRELTKHYKLDPFEYAEAFGTGWLVYTHRGWTRDNAAWFKCETLCGPEWLKPYMDRLKHVTGYDGPIPTIDNVPWNNHGWLIGHTHTVESASIGPEGYRAVGYVNSGDWNGRTAAQRAPGYFAEGVQKDIGGQKHEREFIEMNNGFLKRNPNYLKHHAPHPELTNHALFDCLLQWWLANEASPLQRETMAKALACHRTVCKGDSLGAWLVREYQGVRLDWSGPLITFEAFAAMKGDKE